MAYAAVISLKNTIKRLLNSTHIFIHPASRETMQLAYEEVLSLQEVLQTFDNDSCVTSNAKKVNALDEQIRDTVCTFEDLLETNVSNQLHSQSEGIVGIAHPVSFSLDLQQVEQAVDSFTYSAYMLKERYINELEKENDGNDIIIHGDGDGDGGGGEKSLKMVGLSDQVWEIRDRLVTGDDFLVSLVGMAGIGKTKLANEIFHDPIILDRFECRAWVTVGPKYQIDEIMKCILAQVRPDIAKLECSYKLLRPHLSSLFKDRTHLIVFDDVCSPYFIYKLLDALSYDCYDHGRFLLTTRLKKVAFRSTFHLNVRLLNEEESWNLLREMAFPDQDSPCPTQLVKVGRKIAENCDGLPLTVVTVANLLSKAEKSLEYWEKATKKESSIYTDTYDHISKVLLPSYESLSQRLKACFLYMGVFPQNHKVPCSKLIKLWRAEGFLEPIKLRTLDDFAMKYLKVLVSRSLVMVCEKSSRIKTCRLHSVFWNLCKREAGKSKFFHVLSRYVDSLGKGITCQRRLCIHNNILFSIKDAYGSITSISTARSLLCFGPPHQYPIPICSGLGLLRVLDALTIRFYDFPINVLKLLQLRYLALTYNGNIPCSISKLWNLQFLIVHRDPIIKTYGVNLYLPMEIWDMKELKHLQITGSNLADPCAGVFLPNLLTLLDVSPQSCTKTVLEGLPNLKKLGVQIEFNDYMSYINCVSILHGLESLKCVVVNPEVVRSRIVAPLASEFPVRLKRLTLSGLGHSWDGMRAIALLPKLEVLKLRCYAFRGPVWETEGMEFSGLTYLLIEDTDLVHWTVGENSFPMLKRLSMKHCYNLEQVPEIAQSSDSLRAIELIDCNPSAVRCAKMQMQKYSVDVIVHSSWDDVNLRP